MKVFLSAIENATPTSSETKDHNMSNASQLLVDKYNIRMKWNLMSYYYIREKKALDIAEYVRDNTDEILIDSGAHSFQKGKKADWDEYTKKYAEFIKEFDRPNVLGYFEMDVDNIIGYDKVLELRSVLEDVTDKIIPVWHKNRGIDEFIEMCKSHRGRIVAITGFKNEDITDEQYPLFLKTAWKYGCKLHCLGMTRKEILDKVPFDYTDSSSWVQHVIYGSIDGKRKITKEMSRNHRGQLFVQAYLEGMKMQEYYHNKWQSVCND